jgi:hypothetical protein
VKTKRKSRRGPTKLVFITTAIAWGWHVQSLASGVFGLALVAVLLVTDIDYAMAFPLTIQIALVATAFTLIGLHGARKHWRSVLVGIAIAIPLTMAAIGGILLTGVLTEPDQPLLESMGLAILVKHKLEGAHRNGVPTNTWADLGADAAFDGRYYPPEAISWVPRFSSEGRFIGSIHFQGDESRNIPDCVVTISDAGRPIAKLGEYRRYLPIMPKESR